MAPMGNGVNSQHNYACPTLGKFDKSISPKNKKKTTNKTFSFQT